MKKLAYLILRLFGWKIDKGEIDSVQKAVLVVAPHTSMYDFVIGRMAFFQFGLKVRFVIKKEMFWFPLGIFLKALGGIPINRKNPSGVVEQIANVIKKNDRIFLAITPEGTRKLNKNWKKGFYHIATKAEVPMVLAYIDYKKKVGGVGPIIQVSGNFEADLEQIQSFYKTITAKHPKQFSLSTLENLH